jgi:hypothetical protein
MRLLLSSLILCGLSLSGCSPERLDLRKAASSPDHAMALDDIRASFKLGGTQQQKSGTEKIGISRDALGKEFLFQGSFISQFPVAMWNGLRSRIVSFREHADRLYMLESSQGLNITPHLPTELILTSFAVLEEDSDVIYFDFSEGMNKVFAASDWYASDFGEEGETSRWTVVDVRESMVESRFVESNRFEIDQLAQVQMAEGLDTVKLKYHLTPYRPNASFVPTPAANFERMGFFEVEPRLPVGSGEPIKLATRFDHNKPIEFAVSANTPDEFKDAVREGILYWNKAFGREVINIVDAPEAAVAPSYAMNMVQWVDFDDAGFAYADAQMDPRTGEILHAQVYMASAFALQGKIVARQIINEPGVKSPAASSKKQIALRGFSPTRLCHQKLDERIVESMLKLRAEGASEATVLEIARDYVRSVVAHEIGHTLGLRHNFAGSLAVNYPLSQRTQIVGDYFKNLVVPDDLVPSSSVMEYSDFADSAMSGRIALMRGKTLEYDEKSILALYDKRVYANDELPLFCTDSQMIFSDCRVFDTGKSKVEFADWSREEFMREMPSRFAVRFLSAKFPAEGYQSKSFEEVAINAETIAGGLAASAVSELATLLRDDFGLLSVWRAEPKVTWLNYDEVQQRGFALVEEQIQNAGGFERLLLGNTARFGERLSQEFRNYINGSFKSGISFGGEPYQFSDADIEHMTSIVDGVASQIDHKFIESLVMLIDSEFKNIRQSAATADLATTLNGLATEVLLGQTAEVLYEGKAQLVVNEVASEKDVKILSPKYSFLSRTQSARLLSAARTRDLVWALGTQSDLKAAYKAHVDTQVGSDVLTVDIRKLPVSIARFVQEARMVLASFEMGFVATN